MLCHKFSIPFFLWTLNNLSFEPMHILVIPILDLVILSFFLNFTLLDLLLDNLCIRLIFQPLQTSVLFFFLHLSPERIIIVHFRIHLLLPFDFLWLWVLDIFLFHCIYIPLFVKSTKSCKVFSLHVVRKGFCFLVIFFLETSKFIEKQLPTMLLFFWLNCFQLSIFTVLES